eukprot:m.53955 g.53955  ORF g.53955 m.53955 type:complete len:399 (-) comp11068_c0_seq2:1965-3161(-)
MRQRSGVVVGGVVVVALIVFVLFYSRMNTLTQTVIELEELVRNRTGSTIAPDENNSNNKNENGDDEDVSRAELAEKVAELKESIALSNEVLKGVVKESKKQQELFNQLTNGEDTNNINGNEENDKNQVVNIDNNNNNVGNDHHRRICIAVPSSKRDITIELMESRMRKLASEIDPEKDVVVLRQSFDNRHNELQRKIAKELGFKVVVDKTGWPEIDKPDIPLTFGDSPQRVRWRSKQVADFSAILSECNKEDVDYVLILEDDVTAAKKFTDKLFTQLPSIPDKNFGYMTLYSGMHSRYTNFREIREKSVDAWFIQASGVHGAVALMFRKEVVPGLAEYLMENKFERPVDWLIPGYIGGLQKLRCFEILPNLIQHQSSVSTFSENVGRDKMRSYSFKYD